MFTVHISGYIARKYIHWKNSQTYIILRQYTNVYLHCFTCPTYINAANLLGLSHFSWGREVPSNWTVTSMPSLTAIVQQCWWHYADTAGHHHKEPGTILLALTFVLLVCIDVIPSQPSPLQTKEAQLSQSLLIREMLQTPPHSCGLHWILSRSSWSFLYWGAQNCPELGHSAHPHIYRYIGTCKRKRNLIWKKKTWALRSFRQEFWQEKL